MKKKNFLTILSVISEDQDLLFVCTSNFKINGIV